MLVPAERAAAHAVLVKAIPARDAVLARSPDSVTLWFNEPLESAFSSLSVRDQRSRVVVEGPISAPAKGALRLVVPNALPAGRYAVQYRVLSVDGHVVEGQLDFEIRRAAP